MTLKQVIANAKHQAKVNSPTILSAFAVSGVAGTAYLAGKASWTSAEQVMYQEMDTDHLDAKERIKLVWKNYIPAAVSGVVTVGCIVSAQRAGAKKTAAAQAAFAVAERAFSEYREKVVETIGAGQEQKIRDSIKQEHVDRQHPPAIVVGGGNVMCREDLTGRYFKSDMETLRKACNDINHRMANGMYATLSDLYDILDLDHTSESDYQGWKVGKPLEFEFGTAIFRGEPVLVFSYNYLAPL